MTRALDNLNKQDAEATGWKVHAGDPDAMVVLAKASYRGEGKTVMHSTKAIEVTCQGCILETYTETSDEYGTAIAKQTIWVPGVTMDKLVTAYRGR